MIIYQYDPETLRFIGSKKSSVVLEHCTTVPPPTIPGMEFYFVDSTWSIAPPQGAVVYPVFEISNIVLEGAILVGNIWECYTEQPLTLRAKIGLPPCELPAIIEQVVRGAPVADRRFKAYITVNEDTPGLQDLRVPLKFTNSGNYQFTEERLNIGLAEVNQPFRIAFGKVDIDVFDNVGILT